MHVLLLLLAVLATACDGYYDRYYESSNQWIATDTGVISLNHHRAIHATPQSRPEDLKVDFLSEPVANLQRCGTYHYGIADSHTDLEIWHSSGERRSLALSNRVSRLQCSPTGAWVAAYASSVDTRANAGTVAGLNQLTLVSGSALFASAASAHITLSVPDEPLHILFREGVQEESGSGIDALVIVVGLSRLSIYNLEDLAERSDATPLAMIPLTVDGSDPGITAAPIISASGRRLYLHTRLYGELLRVDLPPLTPRVSLVADTRAAAAITPISEPTALAILQADQRLVLLDEDTEQTRQLAESLDATSATILPGEASSDVSSLVVLTHGATPVVYAVDITQSQTISTRLSADYTTVHQSPDRRYMVFHHSAASGSGLNSLLTIWDTRTAIPRELSIPAGSLHIGFHPRSHSMLMVAVETAHLYVINLATGAVGNQPFVLEVPSDPDPDASAESEPIAIRPEAMGQVGTYGFFLGSTYPMGAVFFVPFGEDFDTSRIVSLSYLHLHNLLDTDEPAHHAGSGR